MAAEAAWTDRHGVAKPLNRPKLEGHTTRRKRRHSRHSTWPMTSEYCVALILANRDEGEQGETFSLLFYKNQKSNIHRHRVTNYYLTMIYP